MTNERVLPMSAQHLSYQGDDVLEQDGFRAELAVLSQRVEARELMPSTSTVHEVEQVMHMGMFGV